MDRRRMFVLVVVTGGILAAAGVAGARVSADVESWSTSFSDAAGDSGTAPDIGAVEVGADDNGDITIAVHSPNVEAAQSIVSILMDTDQSPTVGDPDADGEDYEIDSYNGDNAFTFDRWNQSLGTWEVISSGGAVHVTTFGDATQFVFNRHLIGDAFRLRLFAETITSFDHYGAGEYDSAPDGGVFVYDVSPLVLTAASFAARGAKAGAPLALALTVKRSDDGTLLDGDGVRIACSAKSGARTVPLLSSGMLEAKGVPFATCEFALKKAFRKKVVTASITVTYAGRSVTKTAKLRVK